MVAFVAMQKRKIDLRQLRDDQRTRWPQRRARLAELRRLGAAALKARSARLQAEHFMVALAVLMLFLAIVLSSVLAPPSPPVTLAPSVALNPTSSRTTTATGTTLAMLGAQASATRAPLGTATTVSIIMADSTVTSTLTTGMAYPAPGSGPVGIGTPVQSILGPTPGGSAAQPFPTFQPLPGGPPVSGPANSGSPPPPVNGAGGGVVQPYPGANAPPPSFPPPATSPPRSLPAGPITLPPPPRGFTPVPANNPQGSQQPPSAPPPPAQPTASSNGYPGPGSGGPTTAPPAARATNSRPQPTSAGSLPPSAGSLPPSVGSLPTSVGSTVGAPHPTVGATAGLTTTPTKTPPLTATTVPPTYTATAAAFTVLSGNVHWTTAGSPFKLDIDTLIAEGATVQIDPGVEVQLAPGVQLAVVGSLVAQGTSDAPVRFTGPQGRWAGIFGQPGSAITITNTELHQAGQGGVALSANGGTLHVYSSLITDGGGGISTTAAAVDIEHTRITGNNLPSAPAVLLGLTAGQPATLLNNIVGGNQLSRGTPQVKLQADSRGSGPVRFENNLITATNGVGLDLTTAAAIGGTVRCNGFTGGTTGLAINATTPSNKGFALAIDTNSFTGQANYGASSTIALSAANNWWSDPSGPYDAQVNPLGKGERVGVNLQFQPWLTTRPPCAPLP